MLYEGKVVRTVPTMGLAYLAESATGRVIGFSLSQLEHYCGESYAEAGVIRGARFYFEATDDGRVTFVSQKRSEQLKKQAAAGAR